MDEAIPLARPEVTEADIAAVTEVLRTPLLSSGPQVARFERALADYIGIRDAVAVNSGTSALHLAVRALGLKAGDEVIIPSFAFAAVGNVLLQESLVPVFADIEAETFNLDPGSVERAISTKTKAILYVHTFGIPARVRELRSIAEGKQLALIEDASEALGSQVGDESVGRFGDVAIFAFYPNKVVTTGEGGMLVTQNPGIADHCRRLRNQGRAASSEWYQQQEVGYSYRLSDINCALGTSQLNRLKETLRRRQEIVRWYGEELAGVSQLGVANEWPGSTVGWFTLPILLDERYKEHDRDQIWTEMIAAGIGCARYFAPLHRQPVMRGRANTTVSLDVTESVAARIFQVPFFSALQPVEVRRVCDQLKKILTAIG